MLDGGKRVAVPQSPGGPHAGAVWGDFLKGVDSTTDEVQLTLPFADCVAAVMPYGEESGEYKTALATYANERKARTKAAKPKGAKGAGKGKAAAAGALAVSDDA